MAGGSPKPSSFQASWPTAVPAKEAISNTEKLAIEVIADPIQHGELAPSALNVSFLILREQLAGD